MYSGIVKMDLFEKREHQDQQGQQDQQGELFI